MRSKATVLLTKLAAAERQLNAAIRMSLANEDDLAIHTVGAAAYRILRDVKEKRGRSEFSDLFARGLFYMARDFASGDLSSLPAEISSDHPFMQLVTELADEIRSGRIKSYADLKLSDQLGEHLHWKKFNEPTNFLKHADFDHEKTIALESLDNQQLLLRASAAFIDIMGHSTPEIHAYSIFCFGADPKFRTWLHKAENSAKFRALPMSKKRKYCLFVLRRLREKT